MTDKQGFRLVEMSRHCVCVLMSMLILALSAAAPAKADNTTYNSTYSVGGITVVQPQNQNIGSVSLHAGSGNAMSCGSLGNMFGLNTLAAEFNPSGFAANTLPVGLYALGTSLPILREAIYGAKTLVNMAGSLAGSSCQQMMGAIDKMNGMDSTVVQQCVANKLSNGQTYTQAAMDSAQQSCTSGGASLSDLLGAAGAADKFLAPLDPRSFMSCQLQGSGANIQVDKNGNISSSDLSSMSLGDKVANLAVLLTPTVTASGSGGGYSFGTSKIDGNQVNMTQYLQTFENDIQNDTQALLNNLSGAPGNSMTPAAFQAKYSVNLTSFQLTQQLIASIQATQQGTATAVSGGNIVIPLAAPSDSDKLKVNTPTCIASVKQAQQKQAEIMIQQALSALKSGLLQTFYNMESQARTLANTTKNYPGCSGATGGGVASGSTNGVPVTPATVQSIEATKNTILQMIDNFKDQRITSTPSQNCAAIGQQLRDCLQSGSDWTSFLGSLWQIGDNCDVVQAAQTSTAGSPNNIAAVQDNTQLYQTSTPTTFSPVAFQAIAVLLLVGTIIYFARGVVRAALAQKWVDFAVHGFFILLILSVMATFIFKVGQ